MFLSFFFLGVAVFIVVCFCTDYTCLPIDPFNRKKKERKKEDEEMSENKRLKLDECMIHMSRGRDRRRRVPRSTHNLELLRRGSASDPTGSDDVCG